MSKRLGPRLMSETLLQLGRRTFLSEIIHTAGDPHSPELVWVSVHRRPWGMPIPMLLLVWPAMGQMLILIVNITPIQALKIQILLACLRAHHLTVSVPWY